MIKYNNFSNTVQKDLYESAVIDAYNLTLKDYTKDEIIDILSKDELEIKPVAIINLKSIDNDFEAKLLLRHLTGIDGRIREVVSYMLYELSIKDKTFIEYYKDENSKEILLKSILDINPNVVRNIITFIKSSETLKKELRDKIVSKTNEVIKSLSVFVKEDSPFRENMEKSEKNHAKNKLTFNLYWLLEAISILDIDDIENLEDILTKTSSFLDYTIREKTAQILSKMTNPPEKLLRKLKNDENMYVKNQLL